MPVAVAVAVPVDVLLPVAVDVLVGVEVEVLEELPVAVALNVPEAVSEPDIDCVLVLELLDVAVDVPVPVDVADRVEVDVAVAVLLADASDAPSWTSTSQRYVVAVSETEIMDSMSPASPNVALFSSATLSPFSAVTTASPPPSVSSRSVKRIPGLVGLARIRVSADAPVVISQTCKSAFGRMVPPLPGSVNCFGPRYRS